MNYSIYQLPVEHDNIFMNYRFTKSHGGVNVSDYEKVYAGEIHGTDPVEILEKLFRKFNMNHPADYTGRSLSVSDLVVLEGIGTYFCDSFCWVRVN